MVLWFLLRNDKKIRLIQGIWGCIQVERCGDGENKITSGLLVLFFLLRLVGGCNIVWLFYQQSCVVHISRIVPKVGALLGA